MGIISSKEVGNLTMVLVGYPEEPYEIRTYKKGVCINCSNCYFDLDEAFNDFEDKSETTLKEQVVENL